MARAQGVSLAFMTTLFICVIQRIGGASFHIHNNCNYTVWAAGSPGGGKALASRDSWTVQVELNSTSSISGRFWGRTGCSFDITGQGSCKSGDCGGLLSCQGSGNSPATMVEYDYQFYETYGISYNISLVNGFNLPVSIIPSNHFCDAVSCSSNISAICPPELRVPDGCNSACTRFNTPQYCCTGKYSGNCSATKYSRIFKRQCPQAHTYPADNTAITSTCLGTVNITIVFCGDNATSLQGSPFRPAILPIPEYLITPPNSPHPSGKTSRKMAIFLGSMIGSTALFVMLCFVFGRRVRQWKSSVRTDNNIDERGNFGEVYFDYKVLRDSTGNFDRNNMLGKGGFGEVYKGRLPDGRDVAVKKLNGKQTTQAAEEFLTEVKLISSVRHRNLVRLLGCCRRGHKRLLVFEFMSNNSLDKHLFGEIRNPLRWESRLNIIVGTARGLAYLHGDSDVRIIHRDIKCANILLDDRFHPKIADFGLARFFPESQTHVSTRVGGTIGYTAPEYAVHGQLTEKADVYSYGIVVLEIVSGRKCLDARLPAPLQLLLEWAWNQFEQNQVLDIVDPLLEGQYPREQALRVITIALLCIQGSWTQRPAMSQVVSMLTDNSDRIAQPTRPAFIDAATDTPANFLPIPDSATQPAAPTRTSHGSISVSLLPR